MQPRTRLCANSSKKQCVLSDCAKFVTPLVDVEPFYFFQLSEQQLIFLNVRIKANEKLEISQVIYGDKLLSCSTLVYNKEEIGYLLQPKVKICHSGSYVASVSNKLNSFANKEVDRILKLVHMVLYVFDGAFLAISSKMSSVTQSILEEQ